MFVHITECADQKKCFLTFWILSVWRKYLLWEDIPEENYKFSSSSSDISDAGNIKIFKIHNHISVNQKNNTKLSADNVTTVLLKLKRKVDLRFYKIVLEANGGVGRKNFKQRLKKWTVFAAKTKTYWRN